MCAQPLGLARAKGLRRGEKRNRRFTVRGERRDARKTFEIYCRCSRRHVGRSS
nr:MAG TPA: hypothetical protein [Caudoviricetes sp.]